MFHECMYTNIGLSFSLQIKILIHSLSSLVTFSGHHGLGTIREGVTWSATWNLERAISFPLGIRVRLNDRDTIVENNLSEELIEMMHFAQEMIP